MPFCTTKNHLMNNLKNKTHIFLIIFSLIFICSNVKAEEEEILIQSLADQIQVLTKDLKTIEKAVYQKSDIVSLLTLLQVMLVA